MQQLIECVPNFSEGKNQDKIDRIVNKIKSIEKSLNVIAGADLIKEKLSKARRLLKKDDLEINKWTRFKDWMTITGQVSAVIVLIRSFDWQSIVDRFN